MGIVNNRSSRVGIRLFRPMGRKNVVGPFAEEQIEWRGHLLAHHLAQHLIKIWEGPAAEAEAAITIFVRSTRCLHNAIKRHERKDDNLSHVSMVSVLAMALKLRNRLTCSSF